MLLGNQIPSPNSTTHPRASPDRRPPHHSSQRCGYWIPSKRTWSIPKTGPDTCLLVPEHWWLWLSKGNGYPAGPCQAPQTERGEPHTFVPLQDILVGLEVLLFLHVQVSGWGEVPCHTEVYLNDDWPMPLSLSEPRTVSWSARRSRLENCKSGRGGRLRESAEAGAAEQGAQGGGRRRTGRGNAQAPRQAAGAGPPGSSGARVPSRVSAAANLGEPGGGDQQRQTTRRSPAHGGDRLGAAGAGTLGGWCGRHPGPALGACSGPGRDRCSLAGGRARCLRPGCYTAHLRHFLAAAPQTLARAPGEREGGGGRAEGRGASAEVSAPAGCAPAPAGSAPPSAPLGPSLSGSAAVPQALSTGPPTRADRTAKYAHPRTWPAGPGSPRTRFLFGTHNRCLGNKAADRGHRRAQPPAEGSEALPSEGVTEIRVGNTFQPRLWYGRTPVTPWQRGADRARWSVPRAPLRSPAAPAGGPAEPGLKAWTPARLRARLPRGGQRTGPRSLPSAPQSPPANLPLLSAFVTGPVGSQLSPAYFVTSLFSTYYSFPTMLVSCELE